MEIQSASVAPSVALPKEEFKIESVKPARDIPQPPPQETAQTNPANQTGGILDARA
ncbi:MAG: hypothetical protein KAS64_11730 [Spirochaetes bacterium]|nr:hypothetical protein [Spirochaetota bacterium]